MAASGRGRLGLVVVLASGRPAVRFGNALRPDSKERPDGTGERIDGSS
jgi:hypothetical protein